MSFSYDGEGVSEMGNFKIAPPGEYNCIINEVTEKESKNGDPMISCICEINDGEWQGVRLFHNVTFLEKSKPGAGFALHFLHAIGEPYTGKFIVDPEVWEGKLFRAKIVQEKDQKGIIRNRVGTVLIDENKLTEEVPF